MLLPNQQTKSIASMIAYCGALSEHVTILLSRHSSWGNLKWPRTGDFELAAGGTSSLRGTRRTGHGMDIESKIREARELLGSSLALAAADLLEKLIKDEPTNHEALQLIATAYLVLNDSTKADSYLKRSLAVKSAAPQSEDSLGFDASDLDYSEFTGFSEPEYVPGEEYLGDEDTAYFETKQADSANDVSNTESPDANLDDIWPEFDEPFEVDVADDWEHVLLEEGFTDLEDERIDYEAIRDTGRISLDDRARQIVSEMALEHEVSDELFEILTTILAFHSCHGQTRLAMRKLLEGGISSDELETVFELRHYWAGNEGYSRAYYNSPEPTDAYLNLSWSLGLALVRYLGCDDPEIAERFIEDCFDDWQFNARLIEGFRSFHIYLVHLMEHARWCEPDSPPAYVDYRFFECTEDMVENLPGSPVYQWLADNSLLHTEPSPYYRRRKAEPVEALDEVEVHDA